MDPGIERGMPADECARRILQGVARRKYEIIVGAKQERGLVYLKRFFPALLAKMISRHG
jgi:hypothetical protein